MLGANAVVGSIYEVFSVTNNTGEAILNNYYTVKNLRRKARVLKDSF